MALLARTSLIRLGLGLIVVSSLCAVVLFLSQRTVAPPDADSLGTDEVVFADDDVLDAAPEVPDVPVTSSPEHAVAQAEQLLSSFGGMLADVSPSGDLDVDLFSAPIEEGSEVLSLLDLEERLSGVGQIQLAYAGDAPDAQFVRSGPHGSGWVGGLGGFGGGGGGALGNSPRDQTAQNQTSGGTNAIATNPNDQSGSNGGNSGNSGANTPGNSGNEGQANNSTGGPNTGSPRSGGPGTINGPGPNSTTPLKVPEPSVLLLAGIGLTSLATTRRRRNR
jgi:hypothetical protein